MAKASSGSLLLMDTECNSLLDELQTIWNDVGETDAEKDAMLLELEQECLEIYRRKVVQANVHRTQLRQSIVDSEAEIADICSALGETPVHLRQNNKSLKEELEFITTQLEGMRERRNRRLGQFLEVVEQIHCISKEISPENGPSEILVDEHDLSLRRLEDLHKQLDLLQKEKNDRLGKVVNHLNTLNSLCLVLDIDFKQTLIEVHPSLDEPDESKSISNSTIEKLILTIQRLREVKLQRMHKLQDLASTILEMWHLMDTPFEEQQQFQDVTCNIAASEQEITEPNSLSLGFINRVEEEVRRLEGVKASKMKDLVLKKKLELDELCQRAHLVDQTNLSTASAVEAIETGSVDPSLLLGQIEAQISVVKEEVFSRKEILEKVEKWLAACEEESWLEEYNRDENRYNAGKGTHLTLKRAEKARAIVCKIPGIVENLTTKIMAWEKERGIEFLYNGSSLLCMLEDYINLRQEKEQERRRQRDQRRLHGQLMAEQGLLFGSKPSPSKPLSTKKSNKTSTGRSTKRQSVSLQPLKHDSLSSADDISVGGAGGEEGETPRMPFTPLGQSCSIPSTPPQTTVHDAEEENKTPMLAPISGRKTPMEFCRPMQMTCTPAPVRAQDVPPKIAPQSLEMSVEERRLEWYMVSIP